MQIYRPWLHFTIQNHFKCWSVSIVMCLNAENHTILQIVLNNNSISLIGMFTYVWTTGWQVWMSISQSQTQQFQLFFQMFQTKNWFLSNFKWFFFHQKKLFSKTKIVQNICRLFYAIKVYSVLYIFVKWPNSGKHNFGLCDLGFESRTSSQKWF